MIKRVLLSAFFFIYGLQAIQIPDGQPDLSNIQAPWFTGPLLAPSAITIPPGHINVEPYLYFTAINGNYNHNWKTISRDTFWANQCQVSLQIGVNSWLDFQLNPTVFYNYTKGAGNWDLGDMPVGIDIQLFNFPGPYLISWNTALKLALKEIVPLGKYQNLDPKKLSTDQGGTGSWQTAVGLVWGNVFYLGSNHFLTWRNSFFYNFPAPVHVKNLNAFGGGKGTNGTVYPAQGFQVDIALEINLTQNWAFAIDMVGIWSGGARFKGKTFAPNINPPATQFSLAPALEYNWSANIGIIFGSWFTVAGRNAAQFRSGVLAFNYYH